MSTMSEKSSRGRSDQRAPAEPARFATSSPSHVRPVRSRVEAFGLTHAGLARGTNEDCYLVHPELRFLRRRGRHGRGPAGEVASQMAIDTVREESRAPARSSRPTAGPDLLLGRGRRCQRSHQRDGRRATRQAGMGTTFTGVLVFGTEDRDRPRGRLRAYRCAPPLRGNDGGSHGGVKAMVQAGA